MRVFIMLNSPADTIAITTRFFRPIIAALPSDIVCSEVEQWTDTGGWAVPGGQLHSNVSDTSTNKLPGAHEGVRSVRLRMRMTVGQLINNWVEHVTVLTVGDEHDGTPFRSTDRLNV